MRARWIRDGAMISRGAAADWGRATSPTEFLRWYAPYQFASGKVPCCVDDRGSDPVPENDSQGELIYAIAELYRYGGDRALLATMWPRVDAAVRYMDELRLSERTEANRAVNPAFYGLMPASISHEGYSAKPMHSYWDDFWALRGYKDAVEIAQWLGREDDAKRIRRVARPVRRRPVRVAAQRHRARTASISCLARPSWAISTPPPPPSRLHPAASRDACREALLRNTFERYWHEFRRASRRQAQLGGLHALRTAHGRRLRAARLARSRSSRRCSSSSPTASRAAGTSGPKWWRASRASRSSSATCRMPGSRSDYVRSALDMFAYDPRQRRCAGDRRRHSRTTGWTARASPSKTCARPTASWLTHSAATRANCG